jgi:spermidine/putrescine transport system permease protein
VPPEPSPGRESVPRGRAGGRWALPLYGLAGFTFLYLPLLLLMLFSFNRSETGSFPITGLTLDWYRRLAEELFVQEAFANSLLVATLTTAIAVPVGTACAFGIVRAEFPGKALLASLILMPMVVPGLLIGIALLIVLVPILQLDLSLGTAALGHVVILTPYVVLVVATRLYGFDRTLERAAADLGASGWRVLWHVTLPIVFPGILAASLIVFTLSLDQFGVTLFTIGADSTLPMYIWSQIELGVTPVVNALGTVFILASGAVLAAAQLALLRRGAARR